MRYDVGKTDRLSVMRAQNASDFRPFRRLFLAKYGVGSGYVALRAPYAYAIALLPVGQYGLFFRPIARWAIRALSRPIARWAIRAHFRPGLRYATPRAVFWRPFRALVVGSIEWGAYRDFRARVEMSNI